MFATLNGFQRVWIPACAQTIVEAAVSTSAVDGALHPAQSVSCTHPPPPPRKLCFLFAFVFWADPASQCLHSGLLSFSVSFLPAGRHSRGILLRHITSVLHPPLSLLLSFLHHPFANTISNAAEWYFRLIYRSVIITNMQMRDFMH